MSVLPNLSRLRAQLFSFALQLRAGSSLSLSGAEAALSVRRLTNWFWAGSGRFGSPFGPSVSKAETHPVPSRSVHYQLLAPISRLCKFFHLTERFSQALKILLISNYSSLGLYSSTHSILEILKPK